MAIIIRMAAGFQNVVKANQVTFDVGIRVGDGIANTSLSAQIDYNIRVILPKNTVDESFIRKVSLDKGIILEIPKLCQTSLLDTNIIIIVHIVQTNDLGIRLSGQDTFCQVGPMKPEEPVIKIVFIVFYPFFSIL